ncbi:peptidase inhibitor family I36 protein [Streptosporangium sp. G11]|uniref:peptidase inhibitor family I36 protein n=1 Tax=Streptosporangium sp. G11 TaxID=3436926 RepID=UPI003EC053A7
MRKSFMSVVAGATMVAASLGLWGAASPALAEERGLRLYIGSEFESVNEIWGSSVANLGSYDWNDRASSVRNSDDVAWVLYDDSGFSDRRFCLRAGESVRRLGADPYKFNDKTSAIKRLTTNSCAGYPAFYTNG